MGRKGHKKSRLGCTECKKRHVKCDETRPSCVNCKTANTACSYGKGAGGGGGNGAGTQSTMSVAEDIISSTLSTGNSPITSFHGFDFNTAPVPVSIPVSLSAPVSTASPNLVRSPSNTDTATAAADAAAVNFDHLELLHNFQTETFKSFLTSEPVAHQYMITAVRQGLRHHFLMYEALALSALHLSIHGRPERTDFHRQQSTELQALAVQGFNKIMMDINDDNCIAAFIFSSMMGLHAFCETFTSRARRSNFSTLLDHFTDSMKLIRGIVVVMDGFWETLNQSDLEDMLTQGRNLQTTVVQDLECTPLRQMVDEGDLSDMAKDAYGKSITQLQRGFEGQRLAAASDKAITSIFTWVVTAHEGYTTLLRQRRPEALVILAYYGVLLHRKRRAWAVKDAGRYLVYAIRNYLGSHWNRWLDWPLTVVDDDNDTPLTHTTSTPSFYSPT